MYLEHWLPFLLKCSKCHILLELSHYWSQKFFFEMLKIPPISTIYYLMGLQAKKG